MYVTVKNLLFAGLLLFPVYAAAADSVAITPVPAVSLQTPSLTPAPVPAEPAAKVTAPQSTRIGSVDIARISTESERGKALKAMLLTKKEKLQTRIDGKKKQLDKLKSSIEAKLATMTQQQREAKSKEFQKKVEELQKIAQSSETELLDLQEKESKAFYDTVEQAAAAHGKANGFAVIVVKKELLYIGSAVDAVDVTDALIKALNQENQKK